MKCSAAACFLVLVSAAAPATAFLAGGREESSSAANPIRKVVTMLQLMLKKVEAEGEKEQELYEKYECYCKTSGGDLKKSIAEADTKIPQLQSQIEEAEAKLVQLKEDVKNHQADREAAKAAMASATAIREKEAAAFEKSKTELFSYIEAMAKAIAALEKGMAGGFLQTPAAGILRRLATVGQHLLDADRQDLLAFLDEGAGSNYVPKSGEIVGILKQLKDEMDKDMADALAAEEAAITAYKELMAAKTKEVAALTKAIEEKLERIATLGVKIAEMKNDLTDTEEALIEDTKFLADLEKNCATKAAEWDERSKTRTQEIAAITETIKILNEDDALELFKKTLPSASLIQIEMHTEAARKRALVAVLAARAAAVAPNPQLDLISMALRGKKIGFEKVIKMIDEMVATLKQEQLDDDNKQEYCKTQLDAADDKKKGLEHAIADLEAAIAADEESLATLTAEIAALEDGIKALDKAVVEATEQRKAEHEDFTEVMAQDTAAKEIILFAKNRLNKFYNPKLYKPPAKAESAEEGGAAFAQVFVHQQKKDAPPPPPETFDAYSKKTEESTGVIAMMDLLVKDLDKEMTEATAQEEDAQKDYQSLMADSTEKRAQDSKALADKGAAKADLEGDMEAKKEAKAGSTKELAGTVEYISSLHGECDWLMKYYEVRKEARASEIDALGQAKAVLSGADFSLLQTSLRGKR